MLEVARLIIGVAWLVLFGWWAGQWRAAQAGRSESGRRTNPASMAGMALELTALLLVVVSTVRDPGLSPVLYAAGALLAAMSAWFGVQAGRHLGQQLRIQAVVTHSHRLVTTGPYGVVRHPIYASLFGMILGTALAFSDVRVLFVVVPVFIVGTEIRMHAEEKLLAAHFGAEFEAYRRRVSAYLPGIR